MNIEPRYNPAVMSSRIEALDSLDFYPTPPWGTRALCEYIIPEVSRGQGFMRDQTAWDPACGEGHMVEPLREYFGSVIGSDVHDYGRGYTVGSFVGQGADVATCPHPVDWIITNPPFTLAEEFVRTAMFTARVGVAMLARSVFIESDTRYPMMAGAAFAAFCPFAPRLPMIKGQYDPKASSATSYAWFVWLKERRNPFERAGVFIIPPGAKERCTRATDTEKFAGPGRCGVAGLARKKDEPEVDWEARVTRASSPAS